MTIHDVKDESILKVSSQEQPMSSKYVLWGWGVIDTILIMLESWNLAHNLRLDIMTIHDVKDDPILQNASQKPSMSSKYDFEDRGFLTHF